MHAIASSASRRSTGVFWSKKLISSCPETLGPFGGISTTFQESGNGTRNIIGGILEGLEAPDGCSVVVSLLLRPPSHTRPPSKKQCIPTPEAPPRPLNNCRSNRVIWRLNKRLTAATRVSDSDVC